MKENNQLSAVQTRVLISQAFEGDKAPGPLSVGIVSLVELCILAMPDPTQIRERLRQAEFEPGKAERAKSAGFRLAFDKKFVASPVRNLTHELFGKTREGEPVLILLSEGDSDEGKVVFCSALFQGAIEADAVKAATHVTKRQPFTGSSVRNTDGRVIRRVFWDVRDVAGVRGFVVSGPENVDETIALRAFTAFNQVAARP